MCVCIYIYVNYLMYNFIFKMIDQSFKFIITNNDITII